MEYIERIAENYEGNHERNEFPKRDYHINVKRRGDRSQTVYIVHAKPSENNISEEKKTKTDCKRQTPRM